MINCVWRRKGIVSAIFKKKPKTQPHFFQIPFYFSYICLLLKLGSLFFIHLPGYVDFIFFSEDTGLKFNI